MIISLHSFRSSTISSNTSNFRKISCFSLLLFHSGFPGSYNLFFLYSVAFQKLSIMKHGFSLETKKNRWTLYYINLPIRQWMLDNSDEEKIKLETTDVFLKNYAENLMDGKCKQRGRYRGREIKKNTSS